MTRAPLAAALASMCTSAACLVAPANDGERITQAAPSLPHYEQWPPGSELREHAQVSGGPFIVARDTMRVPLSVAQMRVFLDDPACRPQAAAPDPDDAFLVRCQPDSSDYQHTVMTLVIADGTRDVIATRVHFDLAFDADLIVVAPRGEGTCGPYRLPSAAGLVAAHVGDETVDCILAAPRVWSSVNELVDPNGRGKLQTMIVLPPFVYGWYARVDATDAWLVHELGTNDVMTQYLLHIAR